MTHRHFQFLISSPTKILFTVGILLSISTLGKAQLTDLHDFDGTFGENPFDIQLVALGNTLYGTTENGGAYGYGVIFSIDTNGSGYTDMYDFTGSTDGATPSGSLTLSVTKDTLFGMTVYGGIYGYGNIFSIPVGGGSVTNLYSFNGTDGAYPSPCALTLSISGDSLFGVTGSGGSYSDGNIFSFKLNGSVFDDLHDFNGTADGAGPIGSLTLSITGDTLFGVTEEGGTDNYGTIYSIPKTGGGLTTLHSFIGTDGAYPSGSLTLSVNGDTLYGMTDAGGTYSRGTIYSIPKTGSGLTTMYSFNGADGSGPLGSLILLGDVLYGTTCALEGPPNYGNIFSIKTNGTTFNELYFFNGSLDIGPTGALAHYKDKLYGTSYFGPYVDDEDYSYSGFVFSFGYTLPPMAYYCH